MERAQIGLRRTTLIFSLSALFTACAAPSERFDYRAVELGFTTLDLQGEDFGHRAYAAGISGSDGTLHVYIEHDCTTWVSERYISDDPTPRTPLALELNPRDTGPRLLIGRPCYFEHRSRSAVGCTLLLWTDSGAEQGMGDCRADGDSRRWGTALLPSVSGGGRRCCNVERHPGLDAGERFLVLLFLQRYVT